MEMWKNLMLIIVSLGVMTILILVANKYFKINSTPEEIKGYKEDVIDSILDLVYKCYERNAGSKKSVICYQVKINSNEEIMSSDILEKADTLKIDKYLIKSDDLGEIGKIVIIYENEYIYIKRGQYERIST